MPDRVPRAASGVGKVQHLADNFTLVRALADYFTLVRVLADYFTLVLVLIDYLTLVGGERLRVHPLVKISLRDQIKKLLKKIAFRRNKIKS